MRRFILALLALCALYSHAQKFIDKDGVLWYATLKKASNVDYRGLQFDFDSISVNVGITSNGFASLEINNAYSDEIYVIWDETTMNGSPIVFNDMLMYQIGSSIKPSVIDSGGYISKKITSEGNAKAKMPIVGKFHKDQAKKNKYTKIYLNLTLAVKHREKTSRYQIFMEGIWDGKQVKNYEDLNKRQDFTELEEKYDKLQN